ncbi:hypothetical protein FQZ97_712740 [compost metagenome]
MAEGDRRHVLEVDLQHREVGFRVAADDPRQGLAAVLEGDDDLVGAGDHMVVGQQVAFRAHDHRRTEAGLHAPLLGQVVAEEAAELRVFEQRVQRAVDELGGVQVDHRRRGGANGLGIGHRAHLRQAVARRLAHVHVLARQPDPLRVVLDDQEREKNADQQRPAEETQCLEHRSILRVAGPLPGP